MTEPLVTGVAEVDKALAHASDRGARRAGRKAINAGLQVYLVKIRGAVGGGSTSNRSAARLKRSIRKRQKKNKRANVQEAKVGGGVGRGSGGLARPLVHLFLMGTVDRFTGSRSWRNKGGRATKATGNARRYRGRMNPMDAVPRGAAAASSEAVAVMGAKLKTEIEREARKT